MMICRLVTLVVLLASISAAAADTGKIVRIPTVTGGRCINAKTDELSLQVRDVKTQKEKGWFTETNQAGISVIANLNSDGNPPASHPTVNLVSVASGPPGQVYLPLEYPIASLLPLSADSGKTFTKNIVLQIYLDKVRGPNTFGEVLGLAGQLLSKTSIPINPYTTAASAVVGFATNLITEESKDLGGQLLASVTLQFNDRDETNVDQCKRDGFEATGAIAIIGPNGPKDWPKPLPLANLESDYCWSYNADATYSILYADRKPLEGCQGVSQYEFHDVPNDYVMVLVFAHKVGESKQRTRDQEESRKLCEEMKLSATNCVGMVSP